MIKPNLFAILAIVSGLAGYAPQPCAFVSGNRADEIIEQSKTVVDGTVIGRESAEKTTIKGWVGVLTQREKPAETLFFATRTPAGSDTNCGFASRSTAF